MKIVIGTANFLTRYGFKKKKIPKKEIKKIFFYCKKNKIKNFDTAFSYDSFKNIKGIKFDDFKISSKLKFFDKKNCLYNDEKYLKLFKSRIKEFKIKSFDNLFLHNTEKLSKKEFLRAIKIMEFLKRKKLIKKIGVSIYDENSIRKLSRLDIIDIVQVPLNLCDRRFIKKKNMFFLKKKKIKVQARSIFLQGLLLQNLNKIKNKPYIDKNFFYEFETWIKKNKISKLQACLNFIKCQNKLDSFVIGIENLNQLKDIAHLLKYQRKKEYPKSIISNKKKFFDPRGW